MLWWIFFVVVSAVIISMFQIASEGKKTASRDVEFTNKLQQHNDFNATTLIKGYGNRFFFAIDRNAERLIYITTDFTLALSFDQIISVSLEEDSHIVSSKSTVRALTGGVVGGAIAGGAGMIVGGLSGNARQKKNVSNVDVKIRVRDIDNPVLKISCYDSFDMESEAYSETTGWKSIVYNECNSMAMQIIDLVTVIIDSVDSKEKNTSEAMKLPSSTADELIKLSKLKDAGVITHEEFEQQKKLLLS